MLTLNILGTPKRREALCPTCAYVVLQKGVDGEEITSCNYGGPLRELRITVCECTAYLDRRTIKPARQIGYVRSTPAKKFKATVIKIA